jgi:hypothetical protein
MVSSEKLASIPSSSKRLQIKSEAIMKIGRRPQRQGRDILQCSEPVFRVQGKYPAFRNAGICPAFKIIRKLADNRLQIEALLFRSAGCLRGLFKNAMSDKYYLDLISEYKVLSQILSPACTRLAMEVCPSPGKLSHGQIVSAAALLSVLADCFPGHCSL